MEKKKCQEPDLFTHSLRMTTIGGFGKIQILKYPVESEHNLNQFSGRVTLANVIIIT